jgi:hypothetical protein
MKFKKLILGLLFISSWALAGEPEKLQYELTPEVTVVLVKEPCTVFKTQDGISLWRAYGDDTSINHHAEGCAMIKQVEGENGKIETLAIIELQDTTDKKFFEFVLDFNLFKDKPNI